MSPRFWSAIGREGRERVSLAALRQKMIQARALGQRVWAELGRAVERRAPGVRAWTLRSSRKLGEAWLRSRQAARRGWAGHAPAFSRAWGEVSGRWPRATQSWLAVSRRCPAFLRSRGVQALALAALLVTVVSFNLASCGARTAAVAAVDQERPSSEAATRGEPVHVPDLAPGPPRGPSERAREPLWISAQSGEPLDLRRLANREGAVGLLEGFEEGGTVALTALTALPFAPDAELALARLCEVLPHVAEPARMALLRAVHGIVGQPPEPREQLAPEGRESCAPVLGALQADSQLEASARDWASSALRSLGEHAPTATRNR